MLRPAALLLSLAPLLSCGGLVRPEATLPAGLSCTRTFVAGADLAASLAGRVAGDCVLAGTGTWVGNFVLPANVSLVGGEGSTVVLRGAAKGQPVLKVSGGPKTLVRGVHIDTSGGSGIAIDPGPVTMSGVTITGVDEAGLEVRCGEPDCDQRVTVVDGCELKRNRYGVIVVGAQVRLTGGRVAESTGTAASAGTGLIVTGGGQVVLSGTAVEDNENMGVLVDGAGTRLSTTQVQVRRNLARGLWAQGLRGPQALELVSSEFTGNRGNGLGLVDSEGASLRDSLVEDTIAVPLPGGLGVPPMVGDGVGVFGGSRAVRLERVRLERNARAQVLVDSAVDTVSVTEATFLAPDGGFRLVVQRTDAGVVEAPPGSVDLTPQPLPFEAPRMAVPK